MLWGQLEDRVALVTGGTRGIGRATARCLARAGAAVAVTYAEREASARSLVEDITSGGGRVVALRADAADGARAAEVAGEVTAALGPIDTLVLNAGIARDGVAWKTSRDDWERVLAVNLTGAMETARAVIPGMRERGDGRIVAVSSINGQRGKPGQAAYAASKAGLEALVRTLARELGPRGVRVNAVAPGFVDTEMTAGLDAQIRERARAETALGRIGAPDDVAAVIAFLVSDDARHVTGQVIRVDGGQLIG